MKFLMIKWLMIFLVYSFAQSQERKLILNFISSCKDKNIEITSIRDKYICKNKDITDKKIALDKFIEEGIFSIRTIMQSKDLSKLKIVKATDDKVVQKEFLTTDFSKTFILKENNKIILYFLIENDKIIAFNVMDKGGIKTFLILCN
jgi:hypothetical protein